MANITEKQVRRVVREIGKMHDQCGALVEKFNKSFRLKCGHHTDYKECGHEDNFSRWCCFAMCPLRFFKTYSDINKAFIKEKRADYLLKHFNESVSNACPYHDDSPDREEEFLANWECTHPENDSEHCSYMSCPLAKHVLVRPTKDGKRGEAIYDSADRRRSKAGS